MNKKTNLHYLLEVLNLSSEEEDNVILEYFKEQDSDQFTIGNNDYYMYSRQDALTIMYDELVEELKEEFNRSIDLKKILKSGCVDLRSYVEDIYDEDYLEGGIEGSDYVGNINYLYIFKA